MYTLKFDGLRSYSGRWWTALGPSGRLGEVATQEEARALIEAAAGGPVHIVSGPDHQGPCLFWVLFPGEALPE